MLFFFFQITTGSFYSKRMLHSQWVAPATGADSDVEIDINEEDVYDDALDPDYLMSLSDDDIPVPTSKKSSEYNNCIYVFFFVFSFSHFYMGSLFPVSLLHLTVL